MSASCAGRRRFRRDRPAASRLLLGCALLLVAAPLPGTAAAAPQRGLLVVEGSGTTTSELVLEQDLHLCGPVPALAGGGAYAGALVESVVSGGRTLRAGGLQVRAFGDASRDTVSVLGIDGALPAGRYRVVLFGQGPTRAAFTICDRDAAGVHVAPRTRVPVQFLARAEALAAGRSAASVHLPDSLPPARRAALVTLLQQSRVDAQSTCATSTTTCDRTGASADVSQVPGTSPRALLVDAADARRSLHWSVDGFRTAPDRLRAAALIF